MIRPSPELLAVTRRWFKAMPDDEQALRNLTDTQFAACMLPPTIPELNNVAGDNAQENASNTVRIGTKRRPCLMCMSFRSAVAIQTCERASSRPSMMTRSCSAFPASS